MNLLLTFIGLALHDVRIYIIIQVSLRSRGGNISEDLSLFYFAYNTNFINKLKFNDLKTIKNTNSMTVQVFFNLQNHPTFHSEERVVNFVRGRERFV